MRGLQQQIYAKTTVGDTLPAALLLKAVRRPTNPRTDGTVTPPPNGLLA